MRRYPCGGIFYLLSVRVNRVYVGDVAVNLWTGGSTHTGPLEMDFAPLSAVQGAKQNGGDKLDDSESPDTLQFCATLVSRITLSAQNMHVNIVNNSVNTVKHNNALL